MGDIGPVRGRYEVLSDAWAGTGEARMPDPDPIPVPDPEPVPSPDPVPVPEPVPSPPSARRR